MLNPKVANLLLVACMAIAAANLLPPTPLNASGPAPLQVPPGFVVEQVAGPPLVERPMMAGFDERGRLFVCDSSGFNLTKGKSDILVNNPPHAIRLLEDTDGDGRFDKTTMFADRMTFPMGALWRDGALYTASAPSLWRLEDTDGDGVADRRTELVTKFDFGGNACDIHGPFLGPDGRIYWTHCHRGFDIQQHDGTRLKGTASGVFRMRPDGTDIEIVCAGGMDNPVEAAFTPAGEAFATVNLFIGAPRPRNDAIIHCVEGGLFPYRIAGPEFKRTGDLLPAMTDLGWVAPSGLMRYRGEAFGAEYRDNLFSAQFDQHRIQRHVVERHGATFRAKTEDFLVSTDPDFHPTDIMEDADGSLLVLDTGAWFLRGCPTSQIAKPEIKGAIYRIRRSDAPKLEDPRGLAVAWSKLAPKELISLLDDPRWAVRDRAVEQLAQRGGDGVAGLQEAVARAATVRARQNAIWALTRIETPAARSAVRQGLSDSDGNVRLAAAHSAGLHRDAEGLTSLTHLAVADDMPAVRREAATALGRMRRPAAVPALLEALRGGGDRFLEHAQIFALITIADRAATAEGLKDAPPRSQSPREEGSQLQSPQVATAHVQRAALIALDQMEGGALTREMVTPFLDSSDAALQGAALTLISARPEWADSVASLLDQWLSSAELPDSRRDRLQAALLAFCKDPKIQTSVASALQRDQTPPAVRLLLLEVMAQAPLEKLPPSWIAELGRSLDRTGSRIADAPVADSRVVAQAVATIRARGLTGFDETLLRFGADTSYPAEVRVSALATVAPRFAALNTATFDYLRSQLDQQSPPLLRLAAADALGSSRLSDGQLEVLADSLSSAGAVEFPRLLSAFERSQSPAVGRRLIEVLNNSPGLQSITLDALRRVFKDYPSEVLVSAEPLFKRLAEDAEKQQARLMELEAALAGGNAARGHKVFFGGRAACASCHAVKTEGGKIGPDLSKIAAIRTRRDLLESVVFPSASFARGYEPWIISTSEGRVFTGLMGRDTAEAIYLTAADRSEIRIARSAIEDMQPGRVSIMPQGLEAQLSRQDLTDLLAYLLSLK